MIIGIAGAGAVGCHYGSLLQQAGNEVRFLARGAHLAALQQHGLTHFSSGAKKIIRVQADDHPAVLADADVVLVCCKMTGLEAMLAALAPHLAPTTLLVCLQNGIRAPEMLDKAIPGNPLVAGAAFIGARIEQPGVLVHSAAGGMRLARWRQDDERFPRLLRMMLGAGIPVREETDARLMLWRKLLWNVGFNALTAITRRYAHEMAADAETLSLVRQAMEEAVSVAQSENVPLHESDIEKHIAVTLSMGPVKTSMWQDIEQGRATEVDFINGEVARRGAAANLETPVNRMLTALVHAIETRAGADGEQHRGCPN